MESKQTHEHSFVSRVAEETCKYCGEKREPQENTE